MAVDRASRGDLPPTEVRPRAAVGRQFGFLPRLLARWLFSGVRIERTAIERVRRLAQEGTVVYVMRYCSAIDYLLVNYILSNEGLPLPRIANGVSTLWLRPLRELLRGLVASLLSFNIFGREFKRYREESRMTEAILHGRSVLLFLRSRRIWGRRALERARSQAQPLREIVHGLWGSERPVFLVPLAVFQGRGFRRKESRLATLVYSVQDTPGGLRKLASYVWNARELSVSIGREVNLNRFMEQFRYEGEERLVRRLKRALQIFLYREERVVLGPTLLPKRAVREQVLEAPEVVAKVREIAQSRMVAEAKVWKEARKYFDEMAANFHGIYFALLAWAFNRIWPRIFSGLEVRGLEKLIRRVRQDPVVLVPCHRSHFDYLAISYIFHSNYLSPPHIAAGINLAFWPIGPLFRGAGAYFIRRSFEGNDLYKAVFESYLTFLIREGYTQEFFIEGGRSRTGKILTPKLGMLSTIVRAFIKGVRRDLYLVPVSIHYGRIVEEESYRAEVLGQEKQRESIRGLLRARRLLGQKRGTIYVTFADPISLNEALGEKKEMMRVRAGDPVVEEEKKYFIQKLGFRILREVNRVAVAGATSLSSLVLLSAPRRACPVEDFVIAARAVADLLAFEGVTFTRSLERNRRDFSEVMRFMQGAGLIEVMREGGEKAVLYVPTDKRFVLDFYKNNIIHFFLLPSIMLQVMSRGVTGERMKEELWWWLNTFRWEFALPEVSEVSAEVDRLLEYFGRVGVSDDRAGEEARWLKAIGCGALQNFREAYWVAARTLVDLGGDGMTRKALVMKMRRTFRMYLVLEKLTKPEASSAITFSNAINRYVELGFAEVEKRGRSGREEWVLPGRNRDGLLEMEARLEASLTGKGV